MKFMHVERQLSRCLCKKKNENKKKNKKKNKTKNQHPPQKKKVEKKNTMKDSVLPVCSMSHNRAKSETLTKVYMPLQTPPGSVNYVSLLKVVYKTNIYAYPSDFRIFSSVNQNTHFI